jgi:RNA polymerase sigma factor (sigma-70 family)
MQEWRLAVVFLVVRLPIQWRIVLGPLMTNAPDTRVSLILRLRDKADEQAWREFCRVYEPVIAAVARRHGLQDADVHDLTQQVLVRVANAVEGYDLDPRLGRFSAWLHRIAKNTLVNLLKKKYRAEQSASESWIHQLLDRSETSEVDASLEREYRRALFRIAAARVKDEVQLKMLVNEANGLGFPNFQGTAGVPNQNGQIRQPNGRAFLRPMNSGPVRLPGTGSVISGAVALRPSQPGLGLPGVRSGQPSVRSSQDRPSRIPADGNPGSGFRAPGANNALQPTIDEPTIDEPQGVALPEPSRPSIPTADF